MFTVEDFVSNSRAPEGGIHIIDGSEYPQSWHSELRQPYLDEDGQLCVNVRNGAQLAKDDKGQIVVNKHGLPVYKPTYRVELVREREMRGDPVLRVDNATALRKDQWIMLDATVRRAARERLRAWSDLRAANTRGGFDAMGTMVLEYESVTDPGQAHVGMDGVEEGTNFKPEFTLEGLPLPITHCDFFMTARQLAVSRQRGGLAGDTLRAEIAGRRVAELIEKTLIGITPGVQYGSSAAYRNASKVYGYTNHPDRMTKTDLTSSATLLSNISTTAGGTIVGEVIEMLQMMYAQNFYGPFILYISSGYDALLDNDLKANSDRTIRARLGEIEGISAIRRLDYITEDTMILVQMTADVAEAINGMELTVLQWESHGGMQLNFKVMAIQVPLIRSTYISKLNGDRDTITGIVHATTGG